MTDFVPTETGTTIRMPSTANLMIDSTDRDILRYLQASDFQIQKPYSLMNGFFTRIGLSEFYLEWNTPNISSYFNNNTITLDINGSVPVNVTIPSAFYNIYQAINMVTTLLNNASGITGLGFTVSSIGAPSPSGFVLVPSNLTTVYRLTGNLATQLSLNVSGGYIQGAIAVRENGVLSPHLGQIRYLDFVSSQLTYNQDLKDSTTNDIVRDVLLRYYFTTELPPALDPYGFPIYLGYTPFTITKQYNTPKQIKWNPKMPIGNLTFQVYNQAQVIQNMTPATNWCMTLQVSEV